MKKISELSFGSTNLNNQMEFDEEKSYTILDPFNGEYGEGVLLDNKIGLFGNNMVGYANTTDNMGNIRVLRVY